MLARFRATDDELATEEFFIVQFLHRALCFFDCLHLDEGEAFRALIVPIAYDLRVLHVANAVEQLEEIALGCVKGQVPHV